MLAALGLPVGLLLGLVVHRGDFCMHSAVREVLGRQAGRNVRAYLVALGLQVALVNALAAAGWLLVTVPPIAPVSALVGGLVFGVGMVLTKG
jgi:uncharacterized membrane protein YedE/YeeE